MVNWSHIEEYGKKFHLSTEQINSLKNCFENINIDFLEQFIKLPLNQLPSENELKKNFRDEQEMQRFLLLGILISYPEFEKFYHDSGYPDKMFEDISYDLSIWQEKMQTDFGFPCLTLRIYEWSRAITLGNTLQFGRLQLNLCDYPFEHSIWRNGKSSPDVKFGLCKAPVPDLTKGDKIINIHIPASGPLHITDCIASLKEMYAFFKKYKPDYSYKAFCCFSWMLDPVFNKILTQNSNIVKFQKLGMVFREDSIDSTDETLWRLWDCKTAQTGLDKNNPPELKSSMQRAVADYIFNGGRFAEGIMILFPEEVEKL